MALPFLPGACWTRLYIRQFSSIQTSPPSWMSWVESGRAMLPPAESKRSWRLCESESLAWVFPILPGKVSSGFSETTS